MCTYKINGNYAFIPNCIIKRKTVRKIKSYKIMAVPTLQLRNLVFWIYDFTRVQTIVVKKPWNLTWMCQKSFESISYLIQSTIINGKTLFFNWQVWNYLKLPECAWDKSKRLRPSKKKEVRSVWLKLVAESVIFF